MPKEPEAYMCLRMEQHIGIVPGNAIKIHINLSEEVQKPSGQIPTIHRKKCCKGVSDIMEQTMLIIKPDAVNRCLTGELLTRFEKKGLKIIGMKMEHLSTEKLELHYAHHKDKPFFQGLLKFMSSIPSVLIVLEGKEAVDVVRKMIGVTSGREAAPGTVRGDYSIGTQANLIHASENIEEAKKEISRFFDSKELMKYNKMNLNWLYSEDEK